MDCRGFFVFRIVSYAASDLCRSSYVVMNSDSSNDILQNEFDINKIFTWSNQMPLIILLSYFIILGPAFGVLALIRFRIFTEGCIKDYKNREIAINQLRRQALLDEENIPILWAAMFHQLGMKYRINLIAGIFASFVAIAFLFYAVFHLYLIYTGWHYGLLILLWPVGSIVVTYAIDFVGDSVVIIIESCSSRLAAFNSLTGCEVALLVLDAWYAAFVSNEYQDQRKNRICKCLYKAANILEKMLPHVINAQADVKHQLCKGSTYLRNVANEIILSNYAKNDECSNKLANIIKALVKGDYVVLCTDMNTPTVPQNKYLLLRNVVTSLLWFFIPCITILLIDHFVQGPWPPAISERWKIIAAGWALWSINRGFAVDMPPFSEFLKILIKH